jgi:ABC-type phosphate transport system auxiliary subunit
MSDNVSLVAKGIGAIAINAVISIGLLIYCYERGMGRLWGTPLMIFSVMVSMSIMAVTVVVLSRNKRAR